MLVIKISNYLRGFLIKEGLDIFSVSSEGR